MAGGSTPEVGTGSRRGGASAAPGSRLGQIEGGRGRSSSPDNPRPSTRARGEARRRGIPRRGTPGRSCPDAAAGRGLLGDQDLAAERTHALGHRYARRIVVGVEVEVRSLVEIHLLRHHDRVGRLIGHRLRRIDDEAPRRQVDRAEHQTGIVADNPVDAHRFGLPERRRGRRDAHAEIEGIGDECRVERGRDRRLLGHQQARHLPRRRRREADRGILVKEQAALVAGEVEPHAGRGQRCLVFHDQRPVLEDVDAGGQRHDGILLDLQAAAVCPRVERHVLVDRRGLADRQKVERIGQSCAASDRWVGTPLQRVRDDRAARLRSRGEIGAQAQVAASRADRVGAGHGAVAADHPGRAQGVRVQRAAVGGDLGVLLKVESARRRGVQREHAQPHLAHDTSLGLRRHGAGTHPQEAAEGEFHALLDPCRDASLVGGHVDRHGEGLIGRRRVVADGLLGHALDGRDAGGGELEGVAAGEHADVHGVLQLGAAGGQMRVVDPAADQADQDRRTEGESHRDTAAAISAEVASA